MGERLPSAVFLRVPSDLIYVRPVRKMVEALLLGQGWSEEQIEDAALLATEAVQNAIEHGSRRDGREFVELCVRVEEAAVDLECVDPGTGDDPREALERDPSQPVPMDQPRGRGLFLMYRIATRMDRRLAPSGGLCLRVRLELDPP